VAKKKREVVSIAEIVKALHEHNVLSNGTDMACVLVGAAYLENALGSMLETLLHPGEVTERMLNAPDGILSTFGNRTNMCFALGLIDKKTFDNIRIVARIRNYFAHRHHTVDFSDPAVKADVTKLKMDEAHHEVEKQAVFEGYRERLRFTCCVAFTLGMLSERMELHKSGALPHFIWPDKAGHPNPRSQP
jgi:hypothetical protein